jgi:hypothetical protein
MAESFANEVRFGIFCLFQRAEIPVAIDSVLSGLEK